jgi:hypothetical protein
MDRQHFDDLARALAKSGPTRRTALLLLTGSALAAMGAPSLADAKNQKNGRCGSPGSACSYKSKKPTKPDCKRCCGGTFRVIKRGRGTCCSQTICGTTDQCCLGVCRDGTCQNAPISPLPPLPPLPLPPAQCLNGVKDGNESDVDCGGGTCPRCADAQTCSGDNDCRSGTCPNGTCVACTPLQLCGSDAGGPCQCHQAEGTAQPVCDSNQPLNPASVDACGKCPPGTETCVAAGATVFNCFKRCGSP